MKGSLKKLLTRIAKGQGGFTLIEMIVVVGIIAVLAAVIVPNIGKFIGTGEDGAKDAEQGSMETAFSAMMADKSATTLTPPAAGSIDNWIALPVGTNSVPLWSTTPADRYLLKQTTNYAYCWDPQGNITRQDDAPDVTACP